MGGWVGGGWVGGRARHAGLNRAPLRQQLNGRAPHNAAPLLRCTALFFRAATAVAQRPRASPPGGSRRASLDDAAAVGVSAAGASFEDRHDGRVGRAIINIKGPLQRSKLAKDAEILRAYEGAADPNVPTRKLEGSAALNVHGTFNRSDNAKVVRVLPGFIVSSAVFAGTG
jgi:hypothetical protein